MGAHGRFTHSKNGLTQAQIAEKINVTQTDVSSAIYMAYSKGRPVADADGNYDITLVTIAVAEYLAEKAEHFIDKAKRYESKARCLMNIVDL